MKASIAIANPNEELPSCLEERKKIDDAYQTNRGEPFETTDVCIEKAAKAMDKANERLLKVATGKAYGR